MRIDWWYSRTDNCHSSKCVPRGSGGGGIKARGDWSILSLLDGFINIVDITEVNEWSESGLLLDVYVIAGGKLQEKKIESCQKP